MTDIHVDEIARIAPSLTVQEWRQLGEDRDLEPEALKAKLLETFGKAFPETLWRRHKERVNRLRGVHDVQSVLTDEEREQLGPLPSSSGPVAQRVLEMFDEEHVEELVERLTELRARKARERAAGRRRPREVVVHPYDFKHPARVSHDQMHTLENLHDNFARLFASTLSGAMRRVVDVDTAFIDQTTYREYILSLSNPSCSYEFTLGPTNGRAIIDLAMPVVFGLVDRIFGGTGSSRGVDARLMTQTEMGIMGRVVKRTVQDLERTWEPILDVGGPFIHDIELETNPEFLQITAAPEVVILLAFEVNAPGLSGLVSLCYPFWTLEPVLHRLGVQTYARSRRRSRGQTRADNRLRLGAMDVPAVVELGRTRLPVSSAQSLSPGDVIRLDTRVDDPARVYLGGKPKFLAHPFADDDRLSLQVAGRIPAQFADPYGTVPAAEADSLAERRPLSVVRGHDG